MGKETRYIMKLLKNTDVKIFYTTNNNLGKLITTRTEPKPGQIRKERSIPTGVPLLQ